MMGSLVSVLVFKQNIRAYVCNVLVFPTMKPIE